MLFGDLRSLLHDAPDPQRWDALCALLDAAPAAPLAEQLIPYAQDHLDGWPDALCAAPAHWLARPDDPRLALVATIWISEGSPAHDPRALRALHSAHMPRLRAVRAVYTPIDAALLDALCEAPWAGQLDTLQLDHALLGDALALRLADAPLDALARLYLRHNSLTPACVNALLALPALKLLHLERNMMLQPALRQVRWRPGVEVEL